MSARRYARHRCAICGMCNVAHGKDGGPLWAHTRLDRHLYADFRTRRMGWGEVQCQPRESMAQGEWVTRVRCMIRLKVAHNQGRRAVAHDPLP